MSTTKKIPKPNSEKCYALALGRLAEMVRGYATFVREVTLRNLPQSGAKLLVDTVDWSLWQDRKSRLSGAATVLGLGARKLRTMHLDEQDRIGWRGIPETARGFIRSDLPLSRRK